MWFFDAFWESMPLSYCVGQPSELTGPINMWWCMLPGNVCMKMCEWDVCLMLCTCITHWAATHPQCFEENNSSATVVIEDIAGVLLLTEWCKHKRASITQKRRGWWCSACICSKACALKLWRWRMSMVTTQQIDIKVIMIRQQQI